MEEKNGVTVLIFEIREAKGQFEGKLLRLRCNRVQIRNTNLSLSTSIYQMKFKHANCRTPKLLKTVSNHLKSISCVFNSNQRASKLHFRNICNVRRSSWKVSKEGKLKSNIFIKIRAHRLLKS